MFANRSRRKAMLGIAGVSVLALTLAGCTGSASGEGADGSVTLSLLVDNGEQTVALYQALTDAFTEENPEITINLETRPAGSDGDNLIKTKLSTGEMNDLFFYNSGSLLGAINPDQTLVDVSDQDWVASLEQTFVDSASTDNGFYGAPGGATMGGAMLYNKDIYADLGLEIPRSWDEFMENNRKILDTQTTPVIQTFADSWSSQMFVLGDFYNVSAEDPEWAEQFTQNNRRFAEEPAVAGFKHLQDVAEAGYLNRNFASSTYDDGIRMISTGEGAHYPMLTFAASAIKANYPDALDTVGLFPIPGRSSADNGLTVWMPSALYIPKTTEGAKLDAAKKFLGFVASPSGCDVMSDQAAPTGPYVVTECDLPDDVPALIADMQPYFDSGDTGLALEFLSPVKGPALEQLTVSVGSGIDTATEAAAKYDDDVKKQAQQLGLDGW